MCWWLELVRDGNLSFRQHQISVIKKFEFSHYWAWGQDNILFKKCAFSSLQLYCQLEFVHSCGVQFFLLFYNSSAEVKRFFFISSNYQPLCLWGKVIGLQPLWIPDACFDSYASWWTMSGFWKEEISYFKWPQNVNIFSENELIESQRLCGCVRHIYIA